MPYTRWQKSVVFKEWSGAKRPAFCLASYSTSKPRGGFAGRATLTVFLGTSEIKTLRSLSIRRHGKRLLLLLESFLAFRCYMREDLTEKCHHLCYFPFYAHQFFPFFFFFVQSSDMRLHPLLKPLSIVGMLGSVWEPGGTCELPDWIKRFVWSPIHTCCGWLRITKPVSWVARASWKPMCPKFFIVIVWKLTGGICCCRRYCGCWVWTIIWSSSPTISVQLGITTGVRETGWRASIKTCWSRITVIWIQHSSGVRSVVVSPDVVIPIGWILGKKSSVINGR